jgi:NIMA (never in mitosis gene a)-related kinase
MPREEREAALQEAKLLASLRHPNIVACVESFVDKKSKKLCIVQEYCAGGDVHERLRETKAKHRRGVVTKGYYPAVVGDSSIPLPSGLPESIAVDWFTEILLGMKHVHDRKVLHRDLKTQNVFLTADGRCRLGDFGVSKVLNGTYNLASTAVGTPYYLSPEICLNKKYDHKSDVWSLGCVLYELCAGAHPFDAASLKLLVAKITKGIYAPVPGVSPEVSLAIKAMLQREPKKRPSVNELLQRQPFVSRAEALLDEKTFAAEFSHTVLHARDKNNAVCGKQDVFSDFFADKAPKEAPKENKIPPEREKRERTPPLAPFAPRVPTRRVPSPAAGGGSPSPPRVAETKKTYAEPVPSFLPRVVAVKKKTRDVSAYPRAAPLPFRRARDIGRERDPGDVSGHAAYGGGERAQARARAELERREHEAAREREARERRHRERAALEAASRRRAEEAESRVAERDRARREFKERQAVLRAARRSSSAADASAAAGAPFSRARADDGVAIYVAGGRVAAHAKEKRSSRERSPPPLPLHDPAAQRRRAHSPTEKKANAHETSNLRDAGRLLRDAFAAKDSEKGSSSPSSMDVDAAAREAQSARALAYWESRAEAEQNRKRCVTPNEYESNSSNEGNRRDPFNEKASVEVLMPGDLAYGAVLGVDTAPPDSDAAAALVACGKIVKEGKYVPTDGVGKSDDVESRDATAVKGEAHFHVGEDEPKRTEKALLRSSSDPASDALVKEDASIASGVPSGASLPLRVAALRAQLKHELGAEKFDAAYVSLDSMDESVDAAKEAGALVKRLGSDVAALGRVHRLLVWEDALREREAREARARGVK